MNTFDYRRKREKFVLKTIGENELTVAEIAEQLETDCGNAYGILHTLERKGLLISRREKKCGERKRSFWRLASNSI